MKRSIFSAIIFSVGALTAVQAFGEEQINWSQVPGRMGSNDVTGDFLDPPDPTNVILSNDFTAWSRIQSDIGGANTPTGQIQRLAVLGQQTKPTEQAGESTETPSVMQ